MKLFLQKNAKFLSARGLRPHIPVPPVAGVFGPKPPATGLGLRLQTHIGLRRLGVQPPDPQNSPPIANFWLRAWLHCTV